MHYILAFHCPYEKSLEQREKEVSDLYEGETNKFDSLDMVAFEHVVSDKSYQQPPYAFIDGENNWHEKDAGPHRIARDGVGKTVDWETFWTHHCLLMAFSGPHGEGLIVRANCHR